MDFENKYKEALEKAKAYDEALKTTKKLISAGLVYEDAAIQIFPKLKEGGDEVRKELISLFQDGIDGVNHRYNGSDCRRWIAWLEKQGGQKPKFRVGDTIKCKYDDRQFTIKSVDLDKGTYTYTQEGCGNDIDYADEEFELVEQKPTDKVKPKFKVGDWLIYRTGDTIIQIVNNKNFYESVEIWGQERTDTYNYIEQGFRLWTLADAKDGDVLADGNLPFIFKKIDANKYSYAYCGISVDDGFKIGGSDGKFDVWTWMQDIKPATKEQRDLFFQKMKEAGYEWNADKKELKKIGQKIAEWSEDDEQHIDSLLKRLDGLCRNEFERTRFAISEDRDWLESLKQKYTWKPSDKQMEALKEACDEHWEPDGLDPLYTLYQELKKL